MSALDGKLEPEANQPASAEACALFSIGISLKRIADALTPQGDASSCDLVQQVSEMLTQHHEDSPWRVALRAHRLSYREPVESAPNVKAWAPQKRPKTVDVAGFPTGAANALMSHGIMTIAHLCGLSKAELRRVPCIGEKYAKAVEKRLADFGIALS